MRTATGVDRRRGRRGNPAAEQAPEVPAILLLQGGAILLLQGGELLVSEAS